jgi:hypothetical protein
VRIPFSDLRAEQFVTSEARQLPKDEPGLIVMNLTSTPGAFARWDPLITRRFQPSIHTRVGAVALLRSGYVSGDQGERVELESKVIVNPFARLQLPTWMLERLRSP